MARFLRVLARFLPSPLTVAMLLLWLALALIAGHVLGAYLYGRLETPDKLLGLVAGITIGLPILAAPRFTWEPTGWGIALNVLLLMVFGLFGRSTTEALRQHGDWAIEWVEAHGGSKRAMRLALQVTDTTYQLLDLVPVAQIQERFGVSDEEIDWESLTEAVRRKKREQQAGSEGEPDLASSAKAFLAEATDPRLSKHKVRQPTDEELEKMTTRFVELINLERTRRGLTYLPVRNDLARLATAHANAMIHLGFFDHIDPQGRTPRQRAEAASLDDPNVIELIGKVVNVTDVPREMVDRFLATRSDRRKLLDPDDTYRAMGAALACDGPVCVSTVLLL